MEGYETLQERSDRRLGLSHGMENAETAEQLTVRSPSLTTLAFRPIGLPIVTATGGFSFGLACSSCSRVLAQAESWVGKERTGISVKAMRIVGLGRNMDMYISPINGMRIAWQSSHKD